MDDDGSFRNGYTTMTTVFSLVNIVAPAAGRSQEELLDGQDVLFVGSVPARVSATPATCTMESPQETLLPASTLAAYQKTAQEPSKGDEFYVLVNVVGVALRCVVNPRWPCEALLGAAVEAYHASFKDSEVPECNVVFHRKKQEFLVAGTPICECCASGDELELGVTLAEHGSAQSAAMCSVDGAIKTSEFCVLFHKLPLGFTMKRGNDGNTEVGTIYPKSVATHFSRLTPGVTIVSIAGTSLQDMGLRQVHDLIKNATLPLDIRFRGPELLMSPSMPDPVQQQVPSPPTPAPAAAPPAYLQQKEGCQGKPADRHVGWSSGSNESGLSQDLHRSQSGEKYGVGHTQQHRLDNQLKSTQRPDARASNRRSGPEMNGAAALVKKIEQLKVALLRKHEEAKQIARQLELCSEKLLALRGETSGTVTFRQQPQHQRSASTKQSDATRSHLAAASVNSGRSNFRLTPEVLQAMDQRAGLPRRGAGAYASSNISSVSGYSAQSMPVARSANIRARMARAATLTNADNVSVSSNTSNSSAQSARRGAIHSPRGAVHKNLNKRYNYMPQKYEAIPTSASEVGATSLSSRGAVMSRARVPRDSFITKSESPGVGYYDVKVKDRVKGGEIGDSDRSLPWS
uniref:PDZ domain-containing protein n=1 Tax=Hyaloperonospora arabidopsidis (strain Emoy2) TaxID=559515 RepID=M4B6X4_HYAAE